MRRSLLVLIAASLCALPAVLRAAPAPAASGVPEGGPPALYRPEPALPSPQGWPFPETFPRTMGTGRLGGGASFWTDWIYDDHGAAGIPVRMPVAALAPPAGTYAYPAGPAANNGADVFRAAVGLRPDASWWRVDWNTLVDPAVPIAAWALDTDGDPSTGSSAWGAGSGLASPGVDRVLLVSSRGAWLVDPATGARVEAGAVAVDRAARSFVVRVPRSLLPVDGRWRVRLATGLADGDGTSFRPVGPDLGARPGQPAAYNVAFRTVAQEPPASNFWFEAAQAAALASGDVSAFFLDVRWDDLASQVATPEPLVRGWSNRWYVSSIEPGQGVVEDDGNGPGDLRPNFLGRVQPYGVYVPSSYDAGHPAALTWILHSLGVMHNQYGGYNPALLRQACEERRSICATTLGRAPDGWYFDEAELDFWEVWRSLAAAFRLDPERTALSGYSMGGYATYRFGLMYPHLFASAVPIAGPPTCGMRLAGAFQGAAGGGRCTTEGDTTPLVGNARWLPFHVMHGALDQLVPVASVVEQANEFDRRGLRYRLELYPAEDHLVYAVQDGFSSAAAAMGDARRRRDPGRVDYTWYPRAVRDDLGIGPRSVYWLTGLAARDAGPGSTASVTAVSGGRPEPRVEREHAHGLLVPGDPTPGVYREQRWRLGSSPARTATLDLVLRNVSSLALDPARAGFRPGEAVALHVTTDGPVRVQFGGRSVTLPAGEHRLTA